MDNNITTFSKRPDTMASLRANPRGYSRRTVTWTLVGLFLAALFAALDQDIVVTALPHIIGDLHGFDRYTWITTAYLLTTTVMIPIYGKLSDLFGRKLVLVSCVVFFLIGSILSGMAPTMKLLIGFRHHWTLFHTGSHGWLDHRSLLLAPGVLCQHPLRGPCAAHLTRPNADVAQEQDQPAH